MVESKPSILIISGLDPSGGAGFIADVRVAAAHDLRATGVITAHTEQDTCGVRAVHPVPAEIISDQLRAIASDIEVSAVKIGMLANEAIAAAIADALDAVGAVAVWDPIVRPSSGQVRLYEGEPKRALELLSPHASVITPNIPEAEAIIGRRIRDLADMRSAAQDIRTSLGNHQAAVLLKGGHMAGHESVDVLATDSDVIELCGEPLALETAVHGTGCALSTALACALATGAELTAAARAAKHFVAERMRQPQRPGRGAPCAM